MKSVTAFAPASVANVAAGFDLLGFSCDVTGDTVTVEKITEPAVRIESITGIATNITVEPEKNTATAGLVKLRHDLSLKFGFRVSIEKGIPLGSGMGGSAASAVGAIYAANALIGDILSPEQMIAYALVGEAQASGSYHADNIAPSLLGGMTLARVRPRPNPQDIPKVDVTSIPLPKSIYCVLVLPELSVETKTARGLLKKEIEMKSFVQQSGNLAALIAGCFTNDIGLIGRSLCDVIVEPQRAHLIPGFIEVQKAALSNRALGCSISGAGPSVFAWAKDKTGAEVIKKAMVEAFSAAGVQSRAWAVPVNSKGARLLS